MEKIEKLKGEVFVDAKTFDQDYTGLYMVSNLGRCWSIRGKKLVGRWNNGYFYVSLCNKGKEENMQVGRLMLISFNIPIPEHLKNLPLNKIQASHIDEDSANNRLENLCWESPKENSSRQLRRQRVSKSHKGENCYLYGKFGKEHNNSKPILQYTKSGEFIREWDSLMDVERELGIKNGHICNCCQGKPKYKTAGGYIWRYKK